MTKANNYTKRKEAARDRAIEWQAANAERAASYGELAEAAAYFEKLARRCGLIKEFKENGII